MNLTTLTTAQLRQALAIKEHIEALEQELATITAAPVANTAATSPALDVESDKAEVKKSAPATHGKRGAVKEAIIELVKKAGPAGIAVKEIAAALGKSNASVSIWFIGTGKKVKEIKKLGRGKYGWVSTSTPAAEPAAAAKPEKTTKKQSSVKKSTAKKQKANQRGELKDSIASLVKASGETGITAKKVAAILGLPLPRIYNWFNATGKKVHGINKVGPAKYAWVANSTPAADLYAPIEASAKAKPQKSSARKAETKSYGGVKEAIINLVKASGKAGITVGEIAEKLGVKTGNIYSWFTTTGKKVKQIKKAGPGKYAWKG